MGVFPIHQVLARRAGKAESVVIGAMHMIFVVIIGPTGLLVRDLAECRLVTVHHHLAIAAVSRHIGSLRL